MAKARKGGLGKGLDSLIPEVITESTAQQTEKVIEKEVIVEKPVYVEKEVIVEKEVVVEKYEKMIETG